MEHLWTPWRLDYIRGKGEVHDSCLFCRLAEEKTDAADDLVVARSAHHFALLNRYPYTYGHTMIVPHAHVSSQEDLSTAALTDLMMMTNRMLRVLRQLADPSAFNIGANIGAAAGASIAAHYHFHIVPRWGGDANFIATIGGTRTIPDSLSNIAGDMRVVWDELYRSEPSIEK